MTKQGYITYYEGVDELGQVVFNGNHAVNVDYEDFVHANELFDGCMEYLLTFAQERNPKVKRVVIKNLFKL